jgi:parallel beta helix pectate lyase-like protein/inverse autotransporter-like protein with beta domain
VLTRASLFAVSLISCLTLNSATGLGREPIWRPYIDLEARGSSLRTLGQGNLFLPLAQDRDSMLFADFRGLWTDGGAAEGNWGLAYRKILPSEWIVGLYGFYDFRNSEFGNDFHQGMLGAELLDVNWGVRFNGYVPDQGIKAAPGLAGAFLQGGNIVVQQGLEAAYWGVDFEAERLLWYRDACCDCGDRWSSWGLANLDTELWASAGVFHFDNAANGFENITGPRLRAELRLYDLPMLGNDSRLVLSGQYEHDDVRDSVGTAMITMRIPFGRGGGRSGSRVRGLDRRMVAPIVRDIDIITNAGPFGPAEAAKIVGSTTGNAITGVTFVDGSTANVDTVIEGAGADSVVIASGAAGTITLAGSGNIIDLNSGQALVGGGSGLLVQGCDTGAVATFLAPGTRPTINMPVVGSEVIRLADTNTISGLNITGGRFGVVRSGGGGGAYTITGNRVTGANDEGVFIFGDVVGVITNNQFDNNGYTGFRVLNGDFEGTITGNTFNGNGTINPGNGFEILNGDFVGSDTVVENNTANGNAVDGFRFGANNGSFSNNTANNNTGMGFNGGANNGTATGNVGSNNTGGGNTYP